jgi:hypothetical protein
LEAFALVLSPDARFAATSHGNAVQLWDMAAGGRRLGVLRPRHDDRPAAVTLDGRILLAARGGLHLVDPFGGGAAVAVDGNTGGVPDAHCSPDGRFAVSAGTDLRVRIWDLTTATCLRVLHAGVAVVSARFTADARYVLAGSSTGAVLRWELDWELHTPEVVDWHEDARPLLADYLATGSATSDADAEALLRRARQAGFGWLRPDGVRAELRRMAAAWPAPPRLRIAPTPAAGHDDDDPPALIGVATDAEALHHVRSAPCPRCAAPLTPGEPVEPTVAWGQRWIRIPASCTVCPARFDSWFDLPVDC